MDRDAKWHSHLYTRRRLKRAKLYSYTAYSMHDHDLKAHVDIPIDYRNGASLTPALHGKQITTNAYRHSRPEGRVEVLTSTREL